MGVPDTVQSPSGTESLIYVILINIKNSRNLRNKVKSMG
jgi:hypothetical protein